MAYIALYRKWRPGTFKDLVGQEHISRTLSNAINTGRIGHAYLFSGPRGTGKTSTAKILAKALNCEHGPTPEPCGKCKACQKINDGSSMDVFEIDAASNRGIDEIRDLRETVKFAPVDGRYKVYIIDEVHMLTTEAFNALLKTLEEPPAHVVFILATTEAHKVPPTIQSRCQRYDFKRITVSEIRGRLETVTTEMGLKVEPEALNMIAMQADGGLRDALSLLDQCSALAEGELTAARVRQTLGLIGHEWIYKLTEAIYAHKSQKALEILADLLRDGKDLKQVLTELSLHLRSLMIYQATGTLEQMDLYAEPDEILQEQGKFFSSEEFMGMIKKLHEAQAELKWSPQPRITVEVALMALCNPSASGAVQTQASAAASVDSGRIASLEAKLAQMAAQLAARPAVMPPAAGQTPVAAVPQKSAVRPMPAAASVPEVQAVPITASDAEVWDTLLRTLKERNKMPVFACMNQGQFAGMSESQFFVKFQGVLMADLAMRNYRTLLEEILQEITGRPLRLHCSGENTPAAPPPRPVPKKKPLPPPPPEEPGIHVDLDSMPPEERAPLEKAFEIFGDHVVKIEEDNN
ncbi:DNA polymerase-3 subunit gamma/tau [Selenomonas ruminantium]|uniref:DNA-directed DNA polymerase n=1 Tax=Selenomonas ruminantium TaxID=971 RepID=A0A1M6T4W8_SELRU|nr:DNA polymerase III subunit gamma/tau [Selenomonas ruminantium]SHK51848.1 DNA polymerase-3 subunit gamma/tau [Selenomonas ruminantium]